MLRDSGFYSWRFLYIEAAAAAAILFILYISNCFSLAAVAASDVRAAFYLVLSRRARGFHQNRKRKNRARKFRISPVDFYGVAFTPET